VITPTWETVRLFLHVLGATVWVGGQLVLGALVPALRRAAPEAPAAAARAFDRIAWPAFALLLVTGVWNVVAVRDEVHGAYQVTLVVKLVLVAGSGLAAYAHIRATTPRGRGLFGALTAALALGALLLGVLLAG
jgi:putative copper export protein